MGGGIATGLVKLFVCLCCYLFLCHCWRTICVKCGGRPGLLIYVPILQIIPVLAAARVSPWAFFAFCVPGLNLIVGVWVLHRIFVARRKDPLTMLLLFVPVVGLFALAWLAFSD